MAFAFLGSEVEETRTRPIVLLLVGAWAAPYVWAGSLWILGRLLFHAAGNLGGVGNASIVVLTWSTLVLGWVVSVFLSLAVTGIAGLAGDRGALWRVGFAVLALTSAVVGFPCGLLCLPRFFL